MDKEKKIKINNVAIEDIDSIEIGERRYEFCRTCDACKFNKILLIKNYLKENYKK